MQIWEGSSGLLALLFGARRGLLVDALAAPAGSGGPGHSLLGVLLQVFSLPVRGNGSIGGAAGPPEGMGQEQARARGCRPAPRQHGCPGGPSDAGVTQRCFSLPLGDIGTPQHRPSLMGLTVGYSHPQHLQMCLVLLQGHCPICWLLLGIRVAHQSPTPRPCLPRAPSGH